MQVRKKNLWQSYRDLCALDRIGNENSASKRNVVLRDLLKALNKKLNV